MITVGLINELNFLHTLFGHDVKADLIIGNQKPINISLRNQILYIAYKDTPIWSETLDKHTSMFGLESIECIMDIIKHIDNGDASWREKYITIIT